jgi:ADP-ribosylglycohydrolase
MELVEEILGGPFVARVGGLRRDRVRGMLFGAALGDALGAPHEFASGVPLRLYSGRVEFPLTVNRRFQGGKLVGGLGQVSDDTEMTIALATSIVHGGGYDRTRALRSYLDWANSRCPCLGRNTRALMCGVKTIEGFEVRRKAMRAKPFVQWSQSNGCLMRASPLAAIGEADWRAAAAQDCLLTNFHPICWESVQAYVCAARHLLAGEPPSVATKMALAETTEAAVVAAIEAGRDQDQRDVTGAQKGWVVHALYCAFLALNDDVSTYQDRIDRIIRLGGDTDTNAAIAGALLGASLGEVAMRLEGRTGPNLGTVLGLEGDACGQILRPRRYAAAQLPDLADALSELFD